MKTSSSLPRLVSLAGLVAVVFGGVAHGVLTQRWGPSDELFATARYLEDFPQAFGPWRLQDSTAMDEAIIETLQCAGYVNRAYLNTTTSEVVHVAVIVGPPGPTAVHTPEICYSSREFLIDEGASKRSISIDGQMHTYWTIKFQSKRPGGPRLFVNYAWASNSPWKASKSPRYEFGGKTHLCKLQIAGMPIAADVDGTHDLCHRFLKDLLESGWQLGTTRS